MSSTLLQKAQQALNEKTTKIIPENIRAGVTIFGVTGTYEGSEPESEIFSATAGQIINIDWTEISNTILNNTTSADLEKTIAIASCGDPCTIQFGTYTSDLVDDLIFGIAFEDNGDGAEIWSPGQGKTTSFDVGQFDYLADPTSLSTFANGITECFSKSEELYAAIEARIEGRNKFKILLGDGTLLSYTASNDIISVLGEDG